MPALDSVTTQEYWAAKRDVALADRSNLGRLEMTGADCQDLLHRLSTQDLRTLKAGAGAATVLTSDKGRVIDLVTVYHLGSRLVLLTSPENQGAVMQWLDRYTITEDSKTQDVTATTGLLALLGPKSVELASTLSGKAAADLPPFYHVDAVIDGAAVTIARGLEPAGGLQLLVHERARLPAVKEAILTQGKALGAQAVGAAAYDILRIEAGLWAYGKEIDERYNPLEARLRPFVSFSKGCYIGQEVVARLDTYDKVQKLLVGLVLPKDELPPSGARLFAEGKETGFVTSATVSPGAGGPIAMAYVRLKQAQAGGEVALGAPDGPPAQVVDLPFAGT